MKRILALSRTPGQPRHFDALFGASLLASLLLNGAGVVVASSHLAGSVDLTDLAIVDVARANKLNASLRAAARPRRAPKRQAPRPAPPPPRIRAPRPLVAALPHASIPPPVTAPPPVSGQRIDAGRGSERGIEMPTIGTGGQEAGKSGAGIGDNPGATGIGDQPGQGPATPPPTAPPPIVEDVRPPDPTPPPTPAVIAPPAPVKRAEPEIKPVPTVQPRPKPPKKVAAISEAVVESAPDPEVPEGLEAGTYTVVVRATLTAEGRIADVEVVSSSGDSRVDAAAVAAARRIRARPPTQDNLARDLPVTWTYTIRIE